DLPQVPPKSRLGNKLTSLTFAAVCGLRISDTQTGLRAIPRRALAPLSALEGERFEYETNMLLAARRIGLPIRERTIQTIYIDENATSHYRPLLDSLKILRLILKFMASSLVCAAVDVGSYWLIFRLLAGYSLKTQVFYGTVISRVISSICNYLLNRRAVFHSDSRLDRSLQRYNLQRIVQMLVSYLLVYLLTAALGGASTLIKLVVDSLLFFLSFGIQRDWVFRREDV
ncbi:MAG: GtrA family protein, partial [Oscillospiraceae bacterium]